MRVLLVSHPPLTAELGAAQVALNLAEALRDRGHDAVAWSPAPLPPDTRWWNFWLRQTRGMEEHEEHHGPFDVIDTPAVSASPRLAARTERLVVRSTQPELRYLYSDVKADFTHRIVPSPRALATAVLALARARAIVGGWERAHRIVCQGSLELDWMRRRYPRWAGKMALWVPAPTKVEQDALAEVRRRRTPRTEEGTCFLWMGRWAAHKGTRTLLRFLAARSASHPQDRFTLAGCGETPRRDLPAAWIESGIVRLVPSYGRDELPALLAAHDAGLFTSTIEGWGLSLNEMLESGLTVYATPAGGVADLKPYWGSRLLPFPPPDGPPPESAEPDLKDYYERFSWPGIARRYEEDVLG
jgi:glycosyltransferase involved in cell wall biosynthesis